MAFPTVSSKTKEMDTEVAEGAGISVPLSQTFSLEASHSLLLLLPDKNQQTANTWMWLLGTETGLLGVTEITSLLITSNGKS